jgi:uncharacterized protein YndB with AHSA1/START domain
VTTAEFVYATYIQATPKAVWRALTDPAFTRRYWGATLMSDWQVGSTVTWEQDGVVISDPAQVVLVSEPYRRLAYSWHTFTADFTRAFGFSDEYRAQASSERRSKVTFTIEPQSDDMVKLTVVHDEFDPGSIVLGGIRDGWPAILANLKTLLETGKVLAR